MTTTYSTFMHSRYFNPAFNAAIFDGPIRIYFAQFHEALALKIYFNLQQKFPQLLNEAKDKHRVTSRNVLVMLYPNEESFALSFDEPAFLTRGQLHDDQIVGINGPFEDEKLDSVLAQIADGMQTMLSSPQRENVAEVF